MRKLSLAIVFMTLGLVGCSSHAPRPQMITKEVIVNTNYPRPTPGVVDYVWEEPMIDVIEVPPGLDPAGQYYRPAHREVVEIRQGRWRYDKPRKDLE